MVRTDTYLTFIDLGSTSSKPVEEFSRVLRSKRSRVVHAVRVKPAEEDKISYCLLLRPATSGNDSAVVYHFEVPETTSLHEQIAQILNQNRVKLLDAPPDPPRSKKTKERETTPASPLGTLEKNPWHRYLERKIKELAKNVS